MPDVLTALDVARMLRCSDGQVIRMANGKADQQLPAFKVGNRWRFLRVDVEEFIERRKAEAA